MMHNVFKQTKQKENKLTNNINNNNKHLHVAMDKFEKIKINKS